MSKEARERQLLLALKYGLLTFEQYLAAMAEGV